MAAFLFESYKYLKPDTAEISAALLQQITQELAGISNGDRVTPPTLDTFQPERWAIRVNILWFLSLCLGLGCDMWATLVQQWVRRYIRLTQYSDAPIRRVRIRMFLFEGIQDFHISWVVENTSILLHAAISLFFAGLTEFLFAINDEVADVILVIVSAFAAIYVILTLLPAIFRQCPFQTPLTSIFWYFGHILAIASLSLFTCSSRVRSKIDVLRRNVHEGMDLHLLRMMEHKAELDKAALKSTLDMCRDEDELETFVDAIPSYLQIGHGVDPNAKPDIGARIDDIQSLFQAKGKEAQLRHRLAHLFTSCTNDHKRIEEGARRRRAITCCRAIWEISRASLSIKDMDPVLPLALCDTLHRLTSDTDSAIAASAIRAVAIFKRAILEQRVNADGTKDAERSKDTVAAPAEGVSSMKGQVSPPYRTGQRNDERSDERLNTVTEFTSNILVVIPHLGNPSHMDLEELRMTLEALCRELNGRDFSHADQQRLVDDLSKASLAHAQLGSGHAVSTGTLCP